MVTKKQVRALVEQFKVDPSIALYEAEETLNHDAFMVFLEWVTPDTEWDEIPGYARAYEG